MLSRTQEKLVRSLLSKKGRRKEGLCLVEGEKIIKELEDLVDFTFTNQDTGNFSDFSDTKTPQGEIAVAKIPKFREDQVMKSERIVLLDHVQDPGNVGAFFRLALGFGFTLILRECADPFAPKVIRSASGASFKVPHIECKLDEAQELVRKSGKQVWKLEMNEHAIPFSPEIKEGILVFGNEGQGIMGAYEGQSVCIEHADTLESLSVSHAGAIVMHAMSEVEG